MKFLRFVWQVLLSPIVGVILGVIAIFWFFSLCFFGWAFALESYFNNPTILNLTLYLIYISPIFAGIIWWIIDKWKTFE